MPLPNAYQQYANNKVMTASPAELTLMLYDGAIKFINIALGAIEEKDVQKAHTNILKAEHIIDYLRQTLDMKYAVAQDFENIYSYLASRLIEANLKKDPEILQEVNEHLRSVRDTWKEVMKANGITWRS
jgi:flagellar protein FliS